MIENLKNSIKKVLESRLNLIRLELFFASLFTFLLASLLDFASYIQFDKIIAYGLSTFLLVLFFLSFLKYFQKQKLRFFSYCTYIGALLFTVYIAHINKFNFESFFVLIFVYGFYAITLSGIKIYQKIYVIVGITILASLGLLHFDTGVHWIIIISIILFLNVLGYSTNFTKEYLKKKLREREFFMNHIFNQSKIGMLLIEQKSNIIIEANETASKSLGFEHRYKLHRININDLEVEGKKIFNGHLNQDKSSVELADGRIFTIYQKEADYYDKKYKLIEFSEYKNLKELNYSAEFEKLKDISEESYENLFKQSVSLICIINKKGKIIDVSDTFMDLLGFNKDEIIDKKANILDYENYEEERKIIDVKVWNGEVQRFEKAIVSKGGKVIYIETILKKGKYFGEDVFISNSRDITKRKELENVINRKTEEYENLLENSPISIIVTDEKGKIIELNPAFSAFFGLKKDAFISHQIGDYIDAKHYDRYQKQLDLLKLDKIQAIEMQIEYINDSKIRKQALLKTIKQNNYAGDNELYLTQIVDISERYEYESKLEESRKKYKDLIDNSIVGIAIIKKDEIVFVNKKALQILKIDDENKILGKSRFDFVNKEEGKTLKDRFLDLEKGGNVPLQEFTLRNQNGDKISVEIKPSLIEYENEQCLLISFIDIKDRKEAKEAQQKVIETKSVNESLRLQLEQNRLIQKRLQNAQSYSAGVIESSLDMIFTTDVNGVINTLNSAAKDKLGLDTEDYIQKKFGIFFKDKLLASQILDKLAVHKSFSGEVNMLKKDGTTFPAYLSISYLFNTDKAFLGMMGISRDISELKQKEVEIKTQASKLTSIIESSSHYFFTVNRKLHITSFNKLFENDVLESFGMKLKLDDRFEEIYGNSKFATAGQTDQEIIEYWNKKFSKAFHGNSINFEIERKSISNEEFHREIFLNPIYAENGEINEVSGISHDTTDKRLYEKELKKSLEEKEVLLKEVHHRVKNNMQVISSILNLQSAYVDDERILNALKESQNRIRAMASIHERLYRTSNFSDIKFSSYIQDLAENLVHTYEYSNTEISLKCTLAEVYLTLNLAIPCGLIINELISNSLKYAFQGRSKGLIELYLHKNKEKVELIIQDDGVGIPESMEVDQTDTLGLQLVSTLVEQIEGSLDLDRTKGSKFTISFKPKIEDQ